MIRRRLACVGFGSLSVLCCVVYLQKNDYQGSNIVHHGSIISNNQCTSFTAGELEVGNRPTAVPTSLAGRARLFCGAFPEYFGSSDVQRRARRRKLAYATKYHLLFAEGDRDVLYCSVPKVANTSLKKLLLSLDDRHKGRYNDSNLHSYVTSKFGLPFLLKRGKVDVAQVERAFKVMFVRHPFERLVSFFQDKSRRGTPTGEYFYSAYWNRAMKELRGRHNVDFEKSVVTFEEFVHLLLKIDPESYDLHWQLYSNRCVPCSIDYDLVGTFDDLGSFYRLLGKRDELWENRGPGDTADAAMKYFSKLNRTTVMRLYRIYLKDFLLFGYSVDEYLNAASPS